jgi:hypothetical protein
MKHILTTIIITLAILPASAQTAINITESDHAVNAFYHDTDTELNLQKHGCLRAHIDGVVYELDAAVYQTLPGVWVAAIGRWNFVKVYTATGSARVYFGGMNRTYQNPSR